MTTLQAVKVYLPSGATLFLQEQYISFMKKWTSAKEKCPYKESEFNKIAILVGAGVMSNLQKKDLDVTLANLKKTIPSLFVDGDQK